MTYTLVHPTGAPLPLVVEVPHAGTDVPEAVTSLLAIDPGEVRRDADLYVDRLFANAPAHGAVMLAASVSRYVVDLNRFEHDVDAGSVASASPEAALVPRGLIWRETTDGRAVLSRPLTHAEFEARLDAYYRPYHTALANEIRRLRDRFGYVIVLSGHSMPSVGRAGHGDTGQRRADIVPGTRGRTTAASRVIDAVDTHFRAAGLVVRHDDPYRGGATTQRWGKPLEGIHAVQVEINRAIYMDEAGFGIKADRFAWLARLCDSLVDRLGNVTL